MVELAVVAVALVSVTVGYVLGVTTQIRWCERRHGLK
jgi:hypothetical protein